MLKPKRLWNVKEKWILYSWTIEERSCEDIHFSIVSEFRDSPNVLLKVLNESYVPNNINPQNEEIVDQEFATIILLFIK